ncbi:MAG: ABC transporter substrate-binding protein [Eubacteriales bacterium]|jgi:branched-chain amino acid transport system substrate-binding protein|nr:ABC transporter substrate-binding protein [Eubacteriales bacterium]
MKKFIALTLSACLTIGALAGCGSSSSSSSGSTEQASGGNVIKIGVFEPQTGENGGGGLQEVYGIRYANQVYPTVEIGGTEYTIELVEVDNKSDKTEAVTAAQKLVSEGVVGILGSYGSGVSIAAGDIFAEAGIPAIGCSCTNPQVTSGNDWYFRVCFIDPFQGTVMANYAIQNGYESAAIITQLGDDYSSGLGSYFKSSFEEHGGTIVAEEQFQTNQSDFKAILTNIKAANPDIIFAPSSITTAPLIIKQAREMGITAVIAAGDTWENATIIENAGADAEGIVLSTFYDEAAPANDEAASFLTGFKEYLTSIGEPDVIPAVSALGYDAYLTLVQAIKDAGSTDPAAVRDALVNVQVTGVTGDIKFDENGDADKSLAFIKTVKDGQFQFLKTVSLDDTSAAE